VAVGRTVCEKPECEDDAVSTLQTLDRGARALFVVAARQSGITVAELAAELGVARAICYRLVATLEGHGLLTRSGDGRVRLGASLPVLAAAYWPGMVSLVSPRLQELADRTGATAFLSVAEGDEAVAVLSRDPSSGSQLQVGYRVGSRHRLDRAAAGIAILAGRPYRVGEPAEVTVARDQGFCITRGHLQAGAVGVATAIPGSGNGLQAVEASIGIVAFEGFDAEGTGPLLVQAARVVGAACDPAG
jgi:DNA-binding IclR family transcriptional regulator